MATATKERPILMSAPMIRAILEGRKVQTRRTMKGPIPDDVTMWSMCEADGSWIGWCNSDFGRETQREHDKFTQVAYPKGGGIRCPYGQPGDRLYVKETWARGATDFTGGTIGAEPHEPGGWPVYYRADGERDRSELFRGRWSSGRFMPRWASRITLEVAEVRIQRLQEISEEDAVAEGMECVMGDGTGPGPGYKWHGPGYWDGFSRNDGDRTYHAPFHGICCCYAGQTEGLTPARCAFRHLWDQINGERPGCSWADDPWVWAISSRRIEGIAS